MCVCICKCVCKCPPSTAPKLLKISPVAKHPNIHLRIVQIDAKLTSQTTELGHGVGVLVPECGHLLLGRTPMHHVVEEHRRGACVSVVLLDYGIPQSPPHHLGGRLLRLSQLQEMQEASELSSLCVDAAQDDPGLLHLVDG